MTDSIKQLYQVKNEVQLLLETKRNEWEHRYAEYAHQIFKSLEQVKNNKDQFKEWAPLYLYSTVADIKKSPNNFQLRYKGQIVGQLTVRNNSVLLKQTKNDPANNYKWFGYSLKWKSTDWRSNEATKFRKYFSELPNALPLKSEEHKIESMILTEMEKKDKSKFLGTYKNVRPVKLADISRYQHPTPLRASSPNAIKYSGPKGGGIDILARIGSGAASTLSVFELKPHNISDTQQTITQGLAYTIFLRELLRSTSGAEWFRIFGYGKPIPQKLELNCIALMSHNTPTPTFSNTVINIGDDEIHLHHMFYKEYPDGISITETSLPK